MDFVKYYDLAWSYHYISVDRKPPVFPADEDVQTDTLTGTPQPGSLEALKNMLFKLQTEAAAHAAGNPTTIENLQVRVLRNQTIIKNLLVKEWQDSICWITMRLTCLYMLSLYVKNGFFWFILYLYVAASL